MRMLAAEMRKFFIRQHALLAILVFFVLKLLSMYYLSTQVEAKDWESYDFYLEKLGGALDEEKEQFIITSYQELNDVYKNINDLEEQYEQEEISETAYLEQLQQITQVKQAETQIKVFYNKYQYALKNPQTHYIVDENGWTQLLTEEHLDYLLILLLFFIAVPVFCNEYETEMNYLQLCSKNGRLQLVVIKIITLTALALVLSLASSLIEFFSYRALYGLSFEDAPIQSLAFFEESNSSLSLIELWRWITASKMVGTVFLTIMILAVSVILHKSLLSLIVNALLLVIPSILSNVGKLKYQLPLPTGLLYGTGYFFPNQYNYEVSYETATVEKYVSVSAFTKQELSILAILFFAMICLLLGLIVWNYLGIKQRNRFKLRIISIFLIPTLLLNLSACSFFDNAEEEFYQNSYTATIAFTDRYCFQIEMMNQILCRDLQTGEEFEILRDVFEQQSFNFYLSMFVTNSYLYYLKDIDSSKIEIYRVNLQDFSEEYLYGKSYVNDIFSEHINYILSFVTEESFFIYDSGNFEKYSIDRQTGKWERLNINTVGTLGDYGNTIYYQNNDNHIVAYDIHSKEETVYEAITLRSPYSVNTDNSSFIYGNAFYYTNMLDHNYIYRYCFDTGENTLFLNQNELVDFCANDQFFYFIDAQHNLYQINLTSMHTEEIVEGMANSVMLSVDGMTPYFNWIDENGKSQWQSF